MKPPSKHRRRSDDLHRQMKHLGRRIDDTLEALQVSLQEDPYPLECRRLAAELGVELEA